MSKKDKNKPAESDQAIIVTSADNLRKMIREEVSGAINGVIKKLAKEKEEKQVLTVSEATEFLSISRSHLYKLTSTKRIPHSKQGKRLYFDRAQLEHWLVSNPIDLKNNKKKR